ncbi:MAG: hypothetical protein ACJAXK_000850 [Yoonia sp.]|jgi:hypothetical protein
MDSPKTRPTIRACEPASKNNVLNSFVVVKVIIKPMTMAKNKPWPIKTLQSGTQRSRRAKDPSVLKNQT